MDDRKCTELSLAEFGKHKGFKVVHLNVRSLFRKRESIQCDLLQGNVGILGTSETWLRVEIPNSMVCVPNYQLVRQDRQQRNALGHIKSGGGIYMYVH